MAKKYKSIAPSRSDKVLIAKRQPIKSLTRKGVNMNRDIMVLQKEHGFTHFRESDFDEDVLQLFTPKKCPDCGELAREFFRDVSDVTPKDAIVNGLIHFDSLRWIANEHNPCNVCSSVVKPA